MDERVNEMIQEAQRELTSRHDRRASVLYEMAAMALPPSDPERGPLLLLAADYADDIARVDALLSEAEDLYQGLGRHGKLTEIAMIRGTRAQAAGDRHGATRSFTGAVRSAAIHLAEIANGSLLFDQPISFDSEADLALDQLVYCRRRLAELRGGSK